MLKKLFGSGSLFRLLPEALADEFPEGLAVVLVLFLVVRARLERGWVVLEGQHQYLLIVLGRCSFDLCFIFCFLNCDAICERLTRMIRDL